MVNKRNKAIRITLAALMGLAVVSGMPKSIVEAVDLTKTTSVTVNLAGESSEFLDDLYSAEGTVVDFYKIADAEELPHNDGYVYKDPVVDFGAGKDITDYGYLGELDAKAWDELSLIAAKAVLDPDSTVTAEKKTIEKFGESNAIDLAAGLWLAVPHNDDKVKITADNVTTHILTPRFEYVYKPQLFTLPTKDDLNGDGKIMSSEEDGEWLEKVAITLKPEQKERFIKIVIQKSVQSYEQTTPASFVFEIEAYEDKAAADAKDLTKRMYDNYVGLTVAMNHFTDKAEFTDIPGGTYVVVTEIYKGSSYKITEGTSDVIEKDLAIITEETGDPLFDFNDSYIPDHKSGYGINNHFDKVETMVDGAKKVNWKHDPDWPNSQGGNE